MASNRRAGASNARSCGRPQSLPVTVPAACGCSPSPILRRQVGAARRSSRAAAVHRRRARAHSPPGAALEPARGRQHARHATLHTATTDPQAPRAPLLPRAAAAARSAAARAPVAAAPPPDALPRVPPGTGPIVVRRRPHQRLKASRLEPQSERRGAFTRLPDTAAASCRRSACRAGVRPPRRPAPAPSSQPTTPQTKT